MDACSSVTHQLNSWMPIPPMIKVAYHYPLPTSAFTSRHLDHHHHQFYLSVILEGVECLAHPGWRPVPRGIRGGTNNNTHTPRLTPPTFVHKSIKPFRLSLGCYIETLSPRHPAPDHHQDASYHSRAHWWLAEGRRECRRHVSCQFECSKAPNNRCSWRLLNQTCRAVHTCDGRTRH